MKTNKVTKLGISLLSVAALGVVAPALTDNPVFGASIVKAEEQQKPLKYRIDYIGESGEKVAPSEFGVLNPGETINIYKDIEGHEVVSRFEWLPGYNMDYDTLSTYSGFADGYNYMYLKYKKLDPTPAPAPTPKPEVTPETKPSETPKPEVKPETKPSDTSKPEVKPEPKPSETPKPEVKLEPKPSETPKPEVKPEPAPKAEEKQKPLKYRIDYFDADTGEEISREYGALNSGETINIHKNIDGYEVVSNYSWMPGYNVDYQIMSTYFGGTMDEHYMFLDYKKVNADAKPSETPKPEVKPETKPSETPKPEVTPETKPSETPKPEVKPETKPSETPKPEVKPETKPSEASKPEVKPETKPQTNSNTAPQAPVKPVGQDSNTKADKPVSKTETTALPNTGEQNSILGFAGFLLASLGLAGLTYKGRH